MSVEIDIGEEARNRVAAFVRTIAESASSETTRPDLIVGGGNSGQLMSYIAVRVYDHLDVQRPRILNLPIYRYKPGHRDDLAYLVDNSILEPDVDDGLTELPELRSVFFVDDEIYRGITALTIYDLLRAWNLRHHGKGDFCYWIVAEDQGFDQSKLPTKGRFIPFSQEIDGWSNVIAYMVPSEFGKPIKSILLERDVSSRHCMNVLLNLPLKEFNDDRPRFGFRLHERVASHIPDLADLQDGFGAYLNDRIAAALSEQ